ncbi:MAG: hypothetical protein ACI83B_002649, partial [Sediminicola sp.]
SKRNSSFFSSSVSSIAAYKLSLTLNEKSAVIISISATLILKFHKQFSRDKNHNAHVDLGNKNGFFQYSGNSSTVNECIC